MNGPDSHEAPALAEPSDPRIYDIRAALAASADRDPADNIDAIKAAIAGLDEPLIETEMVPPRTLQEASSVPSSAADEVLHELAEDMLEMLRRLQSIETRVEQVDSRVHESSRAIGAELAAQRRELLGERKGQLARGLFNAVVGHLDALRAMRNGMSEGKDRKDKHVRNMVLQIEAVELTLLTALQGLGFREFQAQTGEPFNPGSMECLGYAPGEPGVVVRAVRPGFSAAEGVARCAGVFIADPRKAHPQIKPPGT